MKIIKKYQQYFQNKLFSGYNNQYGGISNRNFEFYNIFEKKYSSTCKKTTKVFS